MSERFPFLRKMLYNFNTQLSAYKILLSVLRYRIDARLRFLYGIFLIHACSFHLSIPK